MDNKIHPLVERITGAVFLIFIGFVLLLNTTGTVPWSVWGTFFLTFIKLWPVFIIGIGLQIIFSQSSIMKSILNILWTLFVIGIFCLAILASQDRLTLPTSLTDWNLTFIQNNGNFKESTDALKKEFLKGDRINYTFKMTAGDFDINPNSETLDFIKVNSRHYEDHGTVKLSSSASNSIVNIGFEQEFKQPFLGFFAKSPEYKVDLDTSNLPATVDFNITAGDLDANLKELNLESLDLEMTAGSANITLDEDTQNVYIKVTAGSLELNVPKNLRIILVTKSTAGTVEIEDVKVKDGDTVINPAGEKQMRIQIDQTAGDVEISRY